MIKYGASSLFERIRSPSANFWRGVKLGVKSREAVEFSVKFRRLFYSRHGACRVDDRTLGLTKCSKSVLLSQWKRRLCQGSYHMIHLQTLGELTEARLCKHQHIITWAFPAPTMDDYRYGTNSATMLPNLGNTKFTGGYDQASTLKRSTFLM